MTDFIIFEWPSDAATQAKIWDTVAHEAVKLHTLIPGVHFSQEGELRTREVLEPLLQAFGITYLSGTISSFFTNHPEWVDLAKSEQHVGDASMHDLHLLLSGAGSAGLLTWLSAEGLPALSLVDGAVLTSPPSNYSAEQFHEGLKAGLSALHVRFATARLVAARSTNPNWTSAR